MKSYYRLSELDKAFGISIDDAYYLNAETDVSFCVFCKTSDVILGGYRKDKFVGFGCASYSGLISLNKEQQTKLFESKEVSLAKSVLLQKEKVTNYTPDYPFTVGVPNPIIQEWLDAPFNEIPFEQIPFSFMPQQRKSRLKKFVKNIYEATGKNEESISKLPEKFDPRNPIKDELFRSHSAFVFDDLCITAEELEKAKNYLFKSSKQLNTAKMRPIDLLFSNMLIQFPNSKPSQLWDKLRDDINNEPREFDTDEIIDEVGEETLYWFDSHAEPQQMKKKSFYNLIKKLKIN
ncbi:hypothetical protein [Pseudoalteromonas sp. BDTF-M6]|uniref:hypothetical protein n=1 Tax=Pseudoalteromonas sp. BDTF-M6 TaxID=2796132 RepID=UPI001BB0A684|nr:hypothetical protein [Pseudoalteromonas sp. BDTF-M6]MBS3798771.1 hypothetical protein [Pseudoalteromonas sp. BDTF-M6]